MEEGLVIVAVVVGGLISLVTQCLISRRSEKLEHAKWIRNLRSEPLLAFRRELARMAQKYIDLIHAAQMQHTRNGMSDEEARGILQATSNDWNSYVASGDYRRVLSELDDQDIIDKAQHLWQQLVEAHLKTSEKHLVFEELKEIQAGITEVQKLIDQRLQEL